MAGRRSGESTSDLYIRLGLDMADLESGFVNAERTVRDNISRLNRQNTIIDLQAQVEIAGLDETADATRILETRQRALERQLQTQRDRVRLAAAELRNMTERTGENSDQTQRAILAHERARVALSRLELQLQEVQQSQENLNNATRAGASGSIETGDMDAAINQTQILEARQRTLNQQLSAQRDRVRLTEAAYRQLANTQGAASAAAQDMESRLQREQLALQRLQQQLERVSTAQSELAAVNATAAQTSLVDAGQSLQENLSRLGRERDLADLRAQVEIGGLDEATNQVQILETRQRSLNQQLNIQRARIRLVEEAHRRLASAQGTNSSAAQEMEARLQRERLSLQRLEQQLRQVTEAQEDLNNSSGGIEIGGLEDLVGGVLDRIPPQARIAAGAIAGLGTAIIAAGEASTDLIERWRELQTQAYELNMSVNDTENFLRKMRLAGGDIGDFEGFIRGISDAMVKGEVDDPEAMVFSRYGETAFNPDGTIKSFDDLTAAVERMYDKAKAAGEELQMLQMLGGESGIRDAIQYLERWREAEEDAEKIFDAGLDPEEFHEAERALNLYNEQVEEFTDSLENLITPARVASLETLFKVFHDATEYLVENKNEIQSWGFIAAETFDTVINKIKALKAEYDPDSKVVDWLFGGFGDYIANLQKSELQNVNALLEGTIDKSLDGADRKFYDNVKNELFGGILERAAKRQAEYNGEIEKGTKSWADFRAEQEKVVEATERTGIALEQYAIQRTNALNDELAHLNNELEHFGDEYGKALGEIELWRDEALDQNQLSPDELKAIADVYAAKIALLNKQFEEETNERITDLYKETADLAYAATHSAFEKQLRDIEQWKQAQLEKARTAEEVQAIISNAAMKEADAFEREVDRMRGKIESAQDRLARLTLSQYENDIYQAQKQYYQDLQELPKNIADAIYNASVAAAKKRKKEDKSGNYTRRPDGANNVEDFGQLLDFTNFSQQVDSAADSLIKLDAEEVARAEMLRKAGNAVAGFDYSLSQANVSADELADVISGTEHVGDQLTQSLQDTADALGDTLDTADSAINQNVLALRDAATATGTFINGLKNFADIEANKGAGNHFELPEPDEQSKGGRIEIIYGDEPDLDTEDSETPILYSKFAQLGEATDELAQNINSVDFDNLTDSADRAAQNLANIETENITEPIAEPVAEVANTITDFNETLKLLTESSGNVATAFENAAKIFAENSENFSLPNSPAQQPAPHNKSGDMVDKALDATQTGGTIMELIGTAMSAASLFGGPTSLAMNGIRLALVGMGTDIIADIAQQARNFNDSDETAPAKSVPADTSEITTAIEKISQQLSPLENIEKILETIAQENKTPDTLPEQDFSPLQVTLDSFNTELNNAGLIISEFTLALKGSADKINSLTFDVPNFDLASLNFGGDAFNHMTQELIALTQIAGNIAQSVSAIQQQKQPPNITVSPNINIDLGGAYVFDDTMKINLTEDIAGEVADAVKSAVESATTDLY